MNNMGFPKDKTMQIEYALRALQSGALVPPGIMIYSDVFKTAKGLSDAELGKLIRAFGQHRYSGEEPDLSDDRVIDVLYGAFKANIDRDATRYAITSLRNRYSATGSKVFDAAGKSHIERAPFSVWFEREYGCANQEVICGKMDYYEPDYEEVDDDEKDF